MIKSSTSNVTESKRFFIPSELVVYGRIEQITQNGPTTGAPNNGDTTTRYS